MADTETKIFRLADILTKEVSIVDRAANKRKFLLVKRDGGDAAREVQADGAGGFTSQPSTPGEIIPPPSDPVKPGEVPEQPGGPTLPTQPQSPPASPPEPAPAPSPETPPETPPAPAPETPPEPAPEPPPAAMAKATYEGIAGAIEALTLLAQSVKPSELGDVDPPEVEAQLRAAVGKISTEQPKTDGWVEALIKSDDRAGLQKALKSASEKLREVADSLAVDVTDAADSQELAWRISDVLYALVEFSRFEVAQAAMAKADEGARFRELARGLEKALVGFDEVARTPTSKSERADPTPLLEAAEKVLTAYRSQLTELQKRVRELEDEPLPSNRIPIDRHKRDLEVSDQVAWPLDMNAKHLSDSDYDFNDASAKS